MMKSKSDSLKTKKNLRITPYGDYYIKSKVIKSGFTLSPLEIELIFETDQKKYQTIGEQIRYICHLNFGMMSPSHYDSHYNTQNFITVYFPSHTTSSILRHRNLIELLSADKDIDTFIIDLFSEVNSIREHPSNPLLSKTLLERHIMDVELDVKLKADYPIVFEDIEETRNMEIRERALRKFGYENYVKEGFRKKKIGVIHYDDGSSFIFHPDSPEDRAWYKTLEHEKYIAARNDEEKIICFRSDIAFLQVKDTTTGKTYFLKVPPNISRVEEAKAWTFGLNPREYNPVIET